MEWVLRSVQPQARPSCLFSNISRWTSSAYLRRTVFKHSSLRRLHRPSTRPHITVTPFTRCWATVTRPQWQHPNPPTIHSRRHLPPTTPAQQYCLRILSVLRRPRDVLLRTLFHTFRYAYFQQAYYLPPTAVLVDSEHCIVLVIVRPTFFCNFIWTVIFSRARDINFLLAYNVQVATNGH